MAHLNRRHFVFSAALLPACRALPPGSSAIVDEVLAFLARIDAVDRRGPKLGSVIEVNPDAEKIARTLGPRKGALHGMPVLIKDNIDTADRMRTTAGSLALADAPAPKQDAPLVTRLRQAGAVILGKTNLSEWANIRSTRSSSGWSARGGQTRNPHALDRNPSGSSSGSAVAVAAGLCRAAIGTETDGSIVSPSSINGIVGIKPTVGLVSAKGIIPISHSQDTAGPMARAVSDAAALLAAIADKPLAYKLDRGALRGARLGVARQFFGQQPDVARVMRTALDALRTAGAELIDPVEITPVSEYGGAELDVLLFELKADLNAYLNARGVPRLASLADVIEFNNRERGREMPFFGQELFERAQALGGLDSAAYRDALAKCRQAAASIDRAMAAHRLDALIAPTDGPAWLTDYVNGDHYSGGCSTPAAVAGYPHVTVPAGVAAGLLPIGLSFFGAAWSEPRLIALAYAFEQLGNWRREPRYVAHSSASA